MSDSSAFQVRSCRGDCRRRGRRRVGRDALAAAGLRRVLGRGRGAARGARSVRQPARAAPAAPELWDGVAVFAHSRFLYPPIVAELFRAFAVLPYAVAKAIFTALMVGAWVAASGRGARGAARGGLAVALGAGALFYPLYLALERGQVDPLVLLLLVVAFGARTRAAAGGAALAAAAAFKPAVGGRRGRPRGARAVARRRRGARGARGRRARERRALGAGASRASTRRASCRAPRSTARAATSRMLLPRGAPRGARGRSRGGRRAPRRAASTPSPAWEGPASASLPRLLAPDATHACRGARARARRCSRALAVAALAARRRARPAASEALLLWATAVACVVASPAGWVMGLVVALPLGSALVRSARRRGRWRRALGLALARVRVPAALRGLVAAVAGAALVVVARRGSRTRCPGGRVSLLARERCSPRSAAACRRRASAAPPTRAARRRSRAARSGRSRRSSSSRRPSARCGLLRARRDRARARRRVPRRSRSSRIARRPPCRRAPARAVDAARARAARRAARGARAARSGTALHRTTFLYDTLSYHLHAPATWLRDGRLSIVPAVFGDPAPAYAPSNVELLFAFLMAPTRSGALAQAGQVPLAALACAAVAATVREAGGPRAAALGGGARVPARARGLAAGDERHDRRRRGGVLPRGAALRRRGSRAARRRRAGARGWRRGRARGRRGPLRGREGRRRRVRAAARGRRGGALRRASARRARNAAPRSLVGAVATGALLLRAQPRRRGQPALPARA